MDRSFHHIWMVLDTIDDDHDGGSSSHPTQSRFYVHKRSDSSTATVSS
jgi:hypothetical protein